MSKCECGESMDGSTFFDLLTEMGYGAKESRPATLADLLLMPSEPEPVMLEQFEDGHYEMDVTGFGQDDLSTTVTDEILSLRFENDEYGELPFDVMLPKNVTDINITVSKGILRMSLVFKPCDISVNFV